MIHDFVDGDFILQADAVGASDGGAGGDQQWASAVWPPRAAVGADGGGIRDGGGSRPEEKDGVAGESLELGNGFVDSANSSRWQ